MKIIFTEKSKCKESADEELIADKVNKEYAGDIAHYLNSQLTEWSGFEYIVKENDYVLLKQFEEEVTHE